MPPKRGLSDSVSPDDAESGKRPRKSARTSGSDKPSSKNRSPGSVPEGDEPSTTSKKLTASSAADTVVDQLHTEAVASTPSAWTASDEDTADQHTTGTTDRRGNDDHPAGVRDEQTIDDIRKLFSFIDYVPDDVVARLMPFVQKSDDANLRYALSSIPANATWGTTAGTDNYLCIDNKPLTIWAVGNTESPWFVNPEGEPHPRVNIGFRLPYEGDLAVVKKLYEKAKPKRTDLKDVAFAAKRMSTYGSKTGKTVAPFKNVYDATERFKAKSSMTLLPAGVIGKRDIVLVESYFSRWRTDRDKENPRKWFRWNVGLELIALNLLYEAPPDLVLQQAEEPEPVPEIDDDM